MDSQIKALTFDPANQSLAEALRNHVRYSLGREWGRLPKPDLFMALGLSVRDRLVDCMLDTEARYRQKRAKRIYYLSIEFLIGRSLSNNLLNMGLMDECQKAASELDLDLEAISECESDAALGNGGLGRLAACFLDSMATLDLPGYGYGIYYEYGLFQQTIENGHQRERPDNWLMGGTPWTIQRPDEVCYIPVYGRVEDTPDSTGKSHSTWLNWRLIVGVPNDMPVVGYGGETVNVLRLYSARSMFDLDLQVFNQGDYIKSVEQKIATETVSKVLYPSDAVRSGQELRLLQEYFLVACAIRDIVRRYEQDFDGFETFPDQVAIQLNDTHPAIAIAELMRLLIDEEDIEWDQAWDITQKTMGYTNHTLLPEALEKWPVSLLEKVLPRHLQIIYTINHKFLQQVGVLWPKDVDRFRRMSLIEEGETKQVRMANLAIVGSHSINGVSALHSDLVKSNLVPDFHQLWPHRFNNKTNGITQRRWLLVSNPALSSLVTEVVGDGWIRDLRELRGLESVASDPEFQNRFNAVKRSNKERLTEIIAETTGVSVDPDSIFDIQAKRIHEYKRQLLMVMYVIHEYLNLVEDGIEPIAPRTFLIAGKAAPGYWAAKQMIKLVNNVGQIVNNDLRTRDLLKVIFIPDYKVSLAERIIPSANLSEQISTAGKEASGTGNMKFALNGALTIGTLDGANIEICDEVGEENIYIFGLKAHEIQELQLSGRHDPAALYRGDPMLRRVMDCFKTNRFSSHEPELFEWIFTNLVERDDPFFHLADFSSYVETQKAVSSEYLNFPLWTRKAILNVARIGKFSSDRTIHEYAEKIWNVKPCPAGS